MSSSFLLLAVGSSDLSQAENETIFGKAEQIHKMATYFTQNDNFLQAGPFCFTTVGIYSALQIVTVRAPL